MRKDATSYLGLRVSITIKKMIEKLAAAEGRTVSNWMTRVLVREVNCRISKPLPKKDLAPPYCQIGDIQVHAFQRILGPRVPIYWDDREDDSVDEVPQEWVVRYVDAEEDMEATIVMPDSVFRKHFKNNKIADDSDSKIIRKRFTLPA